MVLQQGQTETGRVNDEQKNQFDTNVTRDTFKSIFDFALQLRSYLIAKFRTSKTLNEHPLSLGSICTKKYVLMGKRDTLLDGKVCLCRVINRCFSIIKIRNYN